MVIDYAAGMCALPPDHEPTSEDLERAIEAVLVEVFNFVLADGARLTGRVDVKIVRSHQALLDVDGADLTELRGGVLRVLLECERGESS